MRKAILAFAIIISAIPAFSVGISFSPDSLIEKNNAREVLCIHVKNKKYREILLKCGNKKAVALALALTLGPFGVHRLYLGTEVKVPVIYTLTLGGGLGILPLADIIAIILTKDIEKYVNNPKVIMWIE